MVEVLVFPDVEAVTVAYLKAQLTALDDTARVATYVPSPRPNRLVKVTRNGGAGDWPHTDRPLVVVQCWDTTTVAASTLASLVRGLLWALPSDTTHGADVRRVNDVGGLAFFPDPATSLPRYQVSVQFHTRAHAL